MKAFRLCTALTLSGACLMMASCLDSKNPLTPPDKAKADAGLLGVWRSVDDDGNATYYHVGRAGGKLSEGVLRAISATHLKDGRVPSPGEVFFFSTQIGESQLLNGARVEPNDIEKMDSSGGNPGLVKGYCIVKYKIEHDALLLWTMNLDAKRQTIESDRLKGTVAENSATFTDSPEKIAAFLASPDGAKLFAEKPLRYERVK